MNGPLDILARICRSFNCPSSPCNQCMSTTDTHGNLAWINSLALQARCEGKFNCFRFHESSVTRSLTSPVAPITNATLCLDSIHSFFCVSEHYITDVTTDQWRIETKYSYLTPFPVDDKRTTRPAQTTVFKLHVCTSTSSMTSAAQFRIIVLFLLD